jgi:hypothetical protein
MIWKNKPGKRRWIWVLLIATLMAWTIGSGFAEESNKILPINPVPNIKQPEFPELPPGVREGTIERVERDFMVITDATFRLAPIVRYFSEYEGPGESPLKFKAGTYVGFRLNEQRELYELWLIK